MSIVFLVLCIVSLLGWTLHTRRLRTQLDAAIADRDALSAELDQAYLAGAALADHDQRSSRRAGRQFMRSFKRRRAIVRIARAHRKLRAELRSLGSVPASTWDRTDAEALIVTITDDIADTSPDPHTPAEYRAGWDAALREYGEPAVATLRSATTEIDRLQRGLSGANLHGESLIREREAALLKVDRLRERVNELSEERATAYRAHLGGCTACRQALPEDVAIMAQLGDQR